MPSAHIDIPQWKRPQKTSYELDWADLSVIDLSSFDKPGGKAALAEQLHEAVHKDGFFSVIGTGFTEEEVIRQYSIGQAFFAQPREAKNKPELNCDFAEGNYFGYRPCNEKRIKDTDVLDNVESINIPKFIPTYDNDPRCRQPFLRPFEEEIADFSRKAWDVARKILVLFALILELPEDFFVERHLYESPSEDHLRYMLYHPRSAADDKKVDNSWGRSHTDFGSLTLLWSQNVAGLQIRTLEGEWKYVKPVDNGIIVNVADTLSFWSAGYLRSTIHRVKRPPLDQQIDRLGLFYFVRPGDDADIVPAPSPLLQRLGLVKEDESQEKPVKGLEYVRGRVKNYHNHSNYGDRTGKTFKVGNLEVVDEP